MHPDGQMGQQTFGWMDDGDMRESAEGEKHFKLESRSTVYFGNVKKWHFKRADYRTDNCTRSNESYMNQTKE